MQDRYIYLEPGHNIYNISMLYVKAGDPMLDCEPQGTCTPRVNCTFDSDDCCYEFASPEERGVGSTPWVRYTAGQINQVDHTQHDNQGIHLYSYTIVVMVEIHEYVFT